SFLSDVEESGKIRELFMTDQKSGRKLWFGTSLREGIVVISKDIDKSEDNFSLRYTRSRIIRLDLFKLAPSTRRPQQQQQRAQVTIVPWSPALTDTILRSGRVEVKKAGIGLTTWKGWKERWLVLKSKTLIAYKDSNEVEISFYVPLETLKRLEHRGQRCILLVGSNAQYYLSFPSNNQLEGWCRDIRDLVPSTNPNRGLELMLNITAPVGDANDVVGQIIDDYASPEEESPNNSPDHSFSPSTNETCVDQVQLRVEATATKVVKRQDQPPLQPDQRTIIRHAISILTHSMEPRLLRISDPGGGKSFDLVDLRLRPLLRLKRKWTHLPEDQLQGHDEKEMRAFSEALLDGYVLCQFYNTLHSNPVIRPDIRDTVNVAKFLAQCVDSGLPADDIFQLKDIEEASAESLARVARTIASLVKVVRDSSSRSRAKRALISGKTTDCVEEKWAEKWIETRLEKKSLRFDPDSEFVPSEGIHRIGIEVKDEGVTCKIPKVYQNLLNFLTNISLQYSSQRSVSLRRALDNLSRFICSLDLISSLVESRGYRLRLLQISAEFKLKPTENQRLRDALRKDEEAIANLLNSAVGPGENEFKEALLSLQGEDAQSCVDLIQDILDKCNPEHDELKHKAQRLLVKLSEAQDILPSSLFIKGVKRQDTDAHFGGSFGDIYRAMYRSSEVAIKRIRVFQDTVARDRRKIFRGLCREAILWRTLKHPFVLSFFGVDSDTFPGLFCLVSPWMANGTILKHLGDTGGQDVDLRLFEIAQGLAYLHSQHIVHGDLRGSNILVDADWHACIADFGLAVFSDVTVGTNSSHHAGSVRWMAPELHHPGTFGLKYFRRTFASDVYSFACVCVELYTGKPPFEDVPRDTAALFKVMAGERPARPSRMGDWLWNIVTMCWSQERAERPSMSRVMPPPDEAFDEDISLHGLASQSLSRGKPVRRIKGSRSF
ncbi:hypothetical protein WG66_007610, partial [Moniliophthora roreri]